MTGNAFHGILLLLGLTACGGNPPTGPGGGGTQAGLGPNASLEGRRPFPDDNAWNTPVDQAPVDPNSDALIASIGAGTGLHPDFGANWNGGPFGIPYIVVSGATRPVTVSFQYADESDPGPYPIPADAPVEGGAGATGDRHVLVIDRDHWTLYELFAAYRSGSGWTAGSGAVFDLASDALRPAGWTRADAAGLPIFPGLVRYDEVVEQGAIRHALRFTASHDPPGLRPTGPPLGQQRHQFQPAADGHAGPAQGGFRPDPGSPAGCGSSCTALKTYGMLLADNGSDWYISGAPDARWDDAELHALGQVTGSDFEVVQMLSLVH